MAEARFPPGPAGIGAFLAPSGSQAGAKPAEQRARLRRVPPSAAPPPTMAPGAPAPGGSAQEPARNSPRFPPSKVAQIPGHTERRTPNAEGRGVSFIPRQRGAGRQGKQAREKSQKAKPSWTPKKFLQPPIAVNRGRAQLPSEKVSQGMASSQSPRHPKRAWPNSGAMLGPGLQRFELSFFSDFSREGSLAMQVCTASVQQKPNQNIAPVNH